MNVLYDLVLYAGYYPGWYIFLVTSVLVLSIYLVLYAGYLSGIFLVYMPVCLYNNYVQCSAIFNPGMDGGV